jgi:hypothetical protein
MNEASGEGEKPSPGCGVILLSVLPPLLWFFWVLACFWIMSKIAAPFHQKKWSFFLVFPGGLILAALGGFVLMTFVVKPAKRSEK